jgi:hypothetical protein
MWGPRALENVMGCRYVLDALLVIGTNDAGVENTLFLVHLKALGPSTLSC